MNDNYYNDMKDSMSQKALETAVKSAPVTVAGLGYLVKPTVSTIGKQIPLIGSAFVATDVVDGYIGANKIFNNPDTYEKLYSAAGSAINGFSLGIIPKDEAAKGLGSLINDRYYGTLENITPSKEEIDVKLNIPDGSIISGNKTIKEKKYNIHDIEFFKSISNGLGNLYHKN